MPRHACIVVPGLPHHITQRGNNRQDVFSIDEDRVSYLTLLRQQCLKHHVRVLGYLSHDESHSSRGDAAEGRFTEPRRWAMNKAYTMAAMRLSYVPEPGNSELLQDLTNVVL